MLLITLDTVRADAFSSGASAAERARTPHFDRLATRGVRFERAIAPAPLTLPSHASLLTGLVPPAHGVRDNATDALAPDLPTLATRLQSAGWQTAAVIGSRVLDRRFGLARGFDHYDDAILAEQLGEHGYAERDADAVVDAALDWLETSERDQPVFLWVHFYDPHAPYQADGTSERARYLGEIERCDRALGRLLQAFSGRAAPRDTATPASAARAPAARASEPLVAVVGDHGEMLGEHGEDTHGIFLYRSALEVPLVVVGPGVEPGRIAAPVATRRLAATLEELALGADAKHAGRAELPGPALPLQTSSSPGSVDSDAATTAAIYSESLLPATAYGWAPLRSLRHDALHYVDAPRPELYDLATDPREQTNLVDARPADARRMARALDQAAGEERPRREVAPDPELTREMAQLGYLSGWSQGAASTLDPKDGVQLLARLEQAERLLATGREQDGLRALRALVRESPDTVPFLSRLAGALQRSGRTDESIAVLRRLVERNPQVEFFQRNLASTLLAAGRSDEAREVLETAVRLDPRFADAWRMLAQIAAEADQAAQQKAASGERAVLERAVLERAVAAGTESAVLWLRLGQLEAAAGEETALDRFRRSAELLPDWSLPWLESGRFALAKGRRDEARRALERAVATSPGSREAAAARQLLASLR